MDQATAYMRDQGGSIAPVRSHVREMLQKPAWALTKEEADKRKESEETDLIEFGKSLDYDELLQQLETVEIPNPQPELIEETKLDPPDTTVIAPPLPPLDRSNNFFSFANETVDPPHPFTSSRCDRHIVISADVVRNMPHSVSNLPYLRLCPSV